MHPDPSKNFWQIGFQFMPFQRFQTIHKKSRVRGDRESATDISSRFFLSRYLLSQWDCPVQKIPFQRNSPFPLRDYLMMLMFHKVSHLLWKRESDWRTAASPSWLKNTMCVNGSTATRHWGRWRFSPAFKKTNETPAYWLQEVQKLLSSCLRATPRPKVRH